MRGTGFRARILARLGMAAAVVLAAGSAAVAPARADEVLGISLPTASISSTITQGGPPNFADTYVTPYVVTQAGSVASWKAQFVGGSLAAGPGVPAGIQLKVLRSISATTLQVVGAGAVHDPRPTLQARFGAAYPFFLTEQAAVEFTDLGLQVLPGDVIGLTIKADPAIGGYFYPLVGPPGTRIVLRDVAVGGTIDLTDPFTGSLSFPPALQVSIASADSLSPGTVNLVLAQGASATVSKTLHLGVAPAKADIVIAIDTTGSMAGAISDAKADAGTIVTEIKKSISGARFAVVDFKDYPFAPFGGAGDFAYLLRQSLTSDTTLVQSALNAMSASGGNDEPESYNRVFFETFSDTNLAYDPKAVRILVVLGDSFPHDKDQNTTFHNCLSTSNDDPGRDEQERTADDIDTKAALDGLVAHHTTLHFVTYNPPFVRGPCQSDLAKHTGGTQTDRSGTTTLANQIVKVVKDAAARINMVELRVTAVSPSGFDFSSWVTTTPPTPFGPFTVPAGGLDVPFTETVTVPAGTAVGTYSFDVHAIVDGADRAVQHVGVDVRRQAVSSLQLTADEASIPAGIAQIPIAKIPSSRLALYTGAPAASIPAGSIPAGSIPAGSIPAGSIPAGSIPAGSIPATIKFGDIGLGTLPAGSIPAGSIALQRILLSSIPLLNPANGASLEQVLGCSPLRNSPPQAVTLLDVINDGTVCADGTAFQRLNALRVRDVGLSGLFGSVPFAAMLLGNLHLDQIPPPAPFLTWPAALDESGGSSLGVSTMTNTVAGVAIAGQLGQTDIGSIPAGSIPAGSIPAGSIPAGSINIPATRLGSILLGDISTLSDIVDCTVSPGLCTTAGKTLADASNAGAIKPLATLAQLLAALPPGHPARQITIAEIVAGLVGGASFPWELVDIQGLQDVSGTGKLVHYHADFDFDCSITSSFSVAVHLPAGFFPAAGTSTFSYAGGTPIAAADPTSDPAGFKWATPGSPCASGATTHVRLDFAAFPGLDLGEQRASVSVTANLLPQTAADQAPVLVTQNHEPNDDPSTAPTAAKDTLIVEHLAHAGDVDFVRFPIDGLPPLSRVNAFLRVPQGADFDLAINKPAAAGTSSTPAGSIPAGSIPVEDGGIALDSSHVALAPDTLGDIPAGSIPAGSIPAGSIPAGSISANRGSVNEAAAVVLNGEQGTLTIGVSGYNGSHSDEPAVLRISVTPPPPLPPCPARTFPNAFPAAPTLPASLPSGTKTVFLLAYQRAVAEFGQAAVDALLAQIGDQTTPGTLAARPEIQGTVMKVDGSADVHAAYAAWDANPCSVEAAREVVRKINGVLAGYRTTGSGLPALRFVVLLGSDEMLPFWRQNDPTTLSPELDEAADLAFTTQQLTHGNALYASAAQNQVLTDGAYGNLTPISWLGHDLPLPQLSVSRLVETPGDVQAQLAQYELANGQLDPTTAALGGYDFIQDGVQAASAEVTPVKFPGPPALVKTELLTPPDWDKTAFVNAFFTSPPAIGAPYAHYSHYLAQPASLAAGFASTADLPASAPSSLFFTVGCHAGLNVADALGGAAAKLKDWPQGYGLARAIFIGNTGFGYGDFDTVALSERLMALFAKKLNGDARSIGEQWIDAVNTYFVTAGQNDVYDEKVMLEATFYGPPWYRFKTPGPGTADPAPALQPEGPIQVGSVTITPALQEHDLTDGTVFWSAQSGVEFTHYRSLQPLVTTDVTASGLRAHGAFITALRTEDRATRQDGQPVKPTRAFPIVDLGAHERKPNVPNIFWPAEGLKLAHTTVFGQPRDELVLIAGQFRPSAPGSETGIERLTTSLTTLVGFSNDPDTVQPTIRQVGAVMTSPTTATVFVRVTDNSGSLHKVAALLNDGAPDWRFVVLQNAGGDLWTAQATGLAQPPQVLAEAQDNAGNVAFSANKGINFIAVTADAAGPEVLVESPLPNAVFILKQTVPARIFCSDTGGVGSCVPSSDPVDTSTVGPHEFTATGTDLSGNTTTKKVAYKVRFDFDGFKPPVSNLPTLNQMNAGRTIPIKFSLKDATGGFFRDLNAVLSISSSAIKCPAAAVEPLPDTVDAGTSGLTYSLPDEQYVDIFKTLKSWAGTCRRVFVGLSDGTLHTLDVQFK